MISRKSKTAVGATVILAYLGIFAIFYIWSGPIDYLQEITKEGDIGAPLAFILMAFLAVVVAPLTVVPLIPVASVVFGPFLAGLYAVIGWFLGSVVAFILAREFGKPVLKIFVSLKQIEKYESYISQKMELWWIVLLRMIVPVDALSYALGLFSRVKLWKYSVASLFSIMPFAFVASYAGEAFLKKDFRLFVLLAILFAVLFSFFSWTFYRKGGIREDIREEIREEHEQA